MLGFFPIEEFEERWRNVDDAMRRNGHEVALVWGKTAGTYERSGDIVYLTNFYSTQSGHEPDSAIWNARSYSAVILRPGEKPDLHVDDSGLRPDLIATDRVTWHFDVVKGIGEALKRRRIDGRVAIVGTDFLPVKYMRQLESLTPDITYVPDDDLVRNVRRIKSARELDCFREGGPIVSSALKILMEKLVAGNPQTEAAAAAGGEMIRHGMTWRRMIMNHGDMLDHLERDPLTGYSRDAPQDGDMVRAWIDGIYQGYWLDPGRTAVCGKPSAEQRELVEAAVELCETIRQDIRHGTKVIDVARLGARLTRESGYGTDLAENAWPYYGHGIGCMWEPPLIETRCTDEEEIFEKNMVIGVECFLGHEEIGVAGFEDNLIVTKEGTETITDLPKIWW